MGKRNLTAAAIEKLAPPAAGRLDVFDQLLPWMAVRITPKGHKSFVVRARVRGHLQPITYTLGSTDLLSLAVAREHAREVLLTMRRGIDPRQEKRALAATVAASTRATFAVVAEEFIAEHVVNLRTGQRNASDLRKHLVSVWGNRPIASLDVDDVASVIRRIAEGHGIATATRLLANLKKLLRWAASPARPRDVRLPVNPARDLAASDFGWRATARQVQLSDAHLRAIWQAAEALGDPMGPYLHMLMLSGQRRSEVANMTWNELDLDGEHVWSIPAARMKAKRPHECPLTPAMVALLAELREHRGTGPYVFSADGGKHPITGFGTLKTRLDRAITEPLAPWTLHDIRRAVRTGLGALPSVPHDIRELVIAHVPPALARTYDLHDYRDAKRQALTLWGERLARIVEPPADNVTELRRAAR